jgi:hypothetical protein
LSPVLKGLANDVAVGVGGLAVVVRRWEETRGKRNLQQPARAVQQSIVPSSPEVILQPRLSPSSCTASGECEAMIHDSIEKCRDWHPTQRLRYGSGHLEVAMKQACLKKMSKMMSK